ncbi:ferric reductase [Paenibacillus humicola]|uniref:ferric reductase n=1 Tax=Paenibacillus humicola TaxID=3110540 RepID=UPI00237C46D3|nr:ferric reductase [Paenibacillus humicola]
MISFLVNLPTWQIIRVTGIVSYILLTLGVALGIAYGLPLWPRKMKTVLYKIHSFATISGTALGLLHGAVTVIDTYVPYTWRELLVPFTAHYDPVLSGLGTLCGYAMLLVILTTDLRNLLKRRVWLAFHLLSYPIFAMAAIHGFFMGTDSRFPGIRLLYLASIVLVVLMSLLRSAFGPAGGMRVSRQAPLSRNTPVTQPSRPGQPEPELVSPGNASRRSERFRDTRHAPPRG